MRYAVLFAFVFCIAVTSAANFTYPSINEAAANSNDIVALNYALTLEHLEAYFYNQALSRLSASSFAAYPNGTYGYALLIRDHENAHVATLSSVIRSLGGSPVPECQYTFTNATLSNVDLFLHTAQALENTGVFAYDGAIDTINNLALRTAAATIATVEARHAAFLNYILDDVPFPAAFDNATLPTDIVGIIAAFIGSCPYTIQTPKKANFTSSASFVYDNVTSGFLASFDYRALNQTAADANDIVALNYALTLENFEAYFYNVGLTNLTAARFSAFPVGTYGYLGLIRAHENAHVATLRSVITSMGGRPVNPCTYRFPTGTFTDAASFLAIAKVLENTGVAAYDGAINTINSLGLRTAAATIATVEARHAAYLNDLLKDVPFPAAFDNATMPRDIAQMISSFIASCPYTLQFPQQTAEFIYTAQFAYLTANSALRDVQNENLQKQHLIDFVKAQKCGSAFNYDENFGGPGAVPATINNLADSISENLLINGSDSTDVASVVRRLGCQFRQFIGVTQLSNTFVNIRDRIIVVKYTGNLVDFADTLARDPNYQTLKRCPQYDNLAFGLRIDPSTNPETLNFVIIALASDPSSLCTSGNTTLTATSPYFCNAPCSTIETVSGDLTYIPTPTRVESSYIESNTKALVWRETQIVTPAPVTVDLYALNRGRVSFATPIDNNIISVTPNNGDPSATIPEGTHVVSWFLKFDPVGTQNVNSTQVTGSVVFSSPVLGAIFTQQRPPLSRNRLSETDPTFSTLCINYNQDINDQQIFRGLEYSSILATPERLSIFDNTFFVDAFQAKGLGVDNVRIITQCETPPVCSTNVNVSATIRIIPPPVVIGPGFLQSNTLVFLFRERSWILSRALAVDRVIPGYPDNYNIMNASAVDPQLPAGMAVTSWYFHAETTNGVFTNFTGVATFQDKIIGYIFRAINPVQNAGHETLKATDPLFGDHCTAYSGFGNPQTFRGLEFTTADGLNVDSSGRTLQFDLRVTRGQDDFRVLTQCGSN